MLVLKTKSDCPTSTTCVGITAKRVSDHEERNKNKKTLPASEAEQGRHDQ